MEPNTNLKAVQFGQRVEAGPYGQPQAHSPDSSLPFPLDFLSQLHQAASCI